MNYDSVGPSMGASPAHNKPPVYQSPAIIKTSALNPETMNSLKATPSKQYMSTDAKQPANQTLPAVQQKRRHLPIAGKKKVFNEWGAVMQHQDELEQRVRQEELA